MQAASDRSSHETPPASARKRRPSSSSRVAKDDDHDYRSDSQESRSPSMAKSRRKPSDTPRDVTTPWREDKDEFFLQLAEHHQENWSLVKKSFEKRGPTRGPPAAYEAKYNELVGKEEEEEREQT